MEYLTNQNHLFRAESNVAGRYYGYLFKMKVLEFYRKMGVSLSYRTDSFESSER